MRTPLLAANWKMHGSLAQIQSYCEDLQVTHGVEVVVLPPALFMQSLREHLSADVHVGAQDIGISATGAHTGDIAAEMVFELGGRWTTVGHSERRLDHGEPDDLVATKAAAAIRGGLRPIICVGETLAEREAGHEIAVVERQLEAVVDRVDIAALANAAIGYEPVWAIGTGRTASPAQAQEMHAFIRSKLEDIDAHVAAQMRIVYGGSVKADNAAELFAEEDIDGGLVGGASLDAEQFSAIIAAASASASEN